MLVELYALPEEEEDGAGGVGWRNYVDQAMKLVRRELEGQPEQSGRLSMLGRGVQGARAL